MRKALLYSGAAFIIIIMLFSLVAIKLFSKNNAGVGSSDVIGANRFLEQFSKDIQRVLGITAYRALIGLEEHVSAQGTYVSDVREAVFELLANGSVNNTAYDIMSDTTITEFADRMKLVAAARGLDFDFTLINISLYHVSPFEVLINATFSVKATMRDGTLWDYEESRYAVFSIEELKDPLYTVNTQGRVPVVVKKQTVDHPFISSSNDTSRLMTIFNNSEYIPDALGPSFLMRYTGNFSPSPYGIASLVDTEDLDAQDIIVNPSLSVVDHVYFNNNSTSSHEIVNMPSYVLIDDDHLPAYDAVGKTIT